MKLRLLSWVCLVLGAGAVRAQDLVAVNDDENSVTVNLERSIDFLSNDTFTAGTTVEIVRAPTKGTISPGSGSAWNFMPSVDATGADSFTYRLVNGSVKSNIATVRMTIRAGGYLVASSPRISGLVDPVLSMDLYFWAALQNSDLRVQVWSDVYWLHLSKEFVLPAGEQLLEIRHPVGRIPGRTNGTVFVRVGGVTSTYWPTLEGERLNLRTYPGDAWAGAPLTGVLDGNWNKDCVVQLASSSPYVVVPSSVNVVAGTTPSYRILVNEARWSYPFTIEAKWGQNVQKKTFWTTPVVITSEWVHPVRKGGLNALLKLTLNAKAGAQGLTLGLRSNSEWATPPSTATISNENTTVWVTIPTKVTQITRNITIWSKFKGVEHKSVLTVVP